MISLSFVAIVTLLLSTNAKMIRNNALMSKMVSNFRKDIEPSEVNEKKPEPVLQRMQSLLCKNFQSVPCEMITQDTALRRLIEQSIQQINYKKRKLDKTTQSPRYLTLFPMVNSDEVSNFRHNAHAKPKNKTKEKHKYKAKDMRTIFNRKKIRKFYPHKVKYKDKNTNVKKDFGDYSEEKLSMSVEVPDMTLTRRHQHLAYKVEPADPPVWRIDYMKHAEPSLNMFGFEDRLKGKIMKSSQNVVDDINEQRNDVMHPDLYIKRQFVRKDNTHINSDVEVK